MSSSSISMASSRQFERRQQITRIELPSSAINTQVAELKKPEIANLDKVTVTLSAEQSIQVNLLNRLYGKQVVLPELANAIPSKPQQESIELSAEPISVESDESLSYVLEQQYFYEFESTSFVASGQITLNNGNNIHFDYSMNYTREFESYSEQLFLQQELKDPLVINLSDQPFSLSKDTVSFDIDLDGVKDDIPTLSAGAGFIAFDKNNNGIIDDGSELFGAQTGNGFAELSLYDDNGDGYINKNDKIFSQLLVWQPGTDEQLFRLSDTEVDTLVLDSVTTQYSFTDENNNRLGQMRQSSVYAKQDGSIGGLHQIDLVI